MDLISWLHDDSMGVELDYFDQGYQPRAVYQRLLQVRKPTLNTGVRS